jgi:electron transfer flavoprotein beta subunit
MKALNIIVCVKPIPDPERWSQITIDDVTKTLIRGNIPLVANPLDKHALEEALLLREKYGGKVTVISMAPPQAKAVLREMLAMGADEAVLLSDRLFAGADTLGTAYTLAAGIRKIEDFDLILCGNRSMDGGTSQVGPELAVYLGISHVTYVREIEIIDDSFLRVKRLLEDCYIAYELRIPTLLSVMKEINIPRYPSISGIFGALKREIKVWSSSNLDIDTSKVGLIGSPTQVTDLYAFEVKRECEILRGTPEKVAGILVDRLRELGIL